MATRLSSSQFFLAHAELVGFGAPERAGYQVVRELCDNAIDACRELFSGASLCDNIKKQLEHGPASVQATVHFHRGSEGGISTMTVSVSDCGPGVAPEALPALLGQLYCSSKATGAESSGKYGIGLKMVILYAKAQLGSTLHVSTTRGGETHDFELTIDEATDEPVVLSHDTAGCGPGDDAPGHAGPTGTCMSVDVAAVEKTTLPLLQQYFHGLQHTLSDITFEGNITDSSGALVRFATPRPDLRSLLLDRADAENSSVAVATLIRHQAATVFGVDAAVVGFGTGEFTKGVVVTCVAFLSEIAPGKETDTNALHIFRSVNGVPLLLSDTSCALLRSAVAPAAWEPFGLVASTAGLGPASTVVCGCPSACRGAASVAYALHPLVPGEEDASPLCITLSLNVSAPSNGLAYSSLLKVALLDEAGAVARACHQALAQAMGAVKAVNPGRLLSRREAEMRTARAVYAPYICSALASILAYGETERQEELHDSLLWRMNRRLDYGSGRLPPEAAPAQEEAAEEEDEGAVEILPNGMIRVVEREAKRPRA